jgi:hypothetical protein
MKNIGYAFYKKKKNNWIKIKHWNNEMAVNAYIQWATG